MALGKVDRPDKDCLGLVWERRRLDIGRVELGTDSARNLLADAASMAGCNRNRGALPVIWRSPG